MIFDRTKQEITNLLSPSDIKPIELAKLIEERILESERIYEIIPEFTTVKVADREIHIWMNDSRIVAVQVKKPDVLAQVAAFAKELINTESTRGSTKQRSIYLALRIIEETSDLDPSIISRLLSDDLLYSTPQLEKQERIPRIVERVSKEYPIAKEILSQLLQGDITLMELLDDGFSMRIADVFELVDYVNRRGLFG
jgi:hypothetical protein